MLKYNNIFPGLIAIYLLYILNPYFTWFISGLYLNLLFCGIFTILFLHYITNYYDFKINKKVLITILITVIFSVYLYSGKISNAPPNLGRLIQYYPLLLILIMYQEVFYKDAYLIVRKIFYIISAYSLVVFVLLAIGLNLPYLEFIGDHRSSTSDTYRTYGLSIGLFRSGNPISALPGSNIIRSSGIFAEPGHFGIYLAMILIVEKFDFTSIRNKVIFVAGLSTFSTAFIFLIILYYSVTFIWHRKLKLKKMTGIVLIVLLSIPLILSQDIMRNVQYLAYERNFQVEGENNIIEARIHQNFLNEFNNYLVHGNKYIGIDNHSSSELEIRTSNVIMLIYIYGIIGLKLTLIMIYFISRFSNNNEFMMLIIFSLLMILIHRYWIMILPNMYLFSLLLISYDNQIKIK